MLSRDEVEATILELEGKDTSFAVCEKLAWLYIIRNELRGTPALIQCRDSNSDFARAVKGKDAKEVWDILSELMETLKVMNPRAYKETILRLDRLQSVK